MKPVARNAMWSVVGSVWPAILMLIGVPFFIRFLGIRDYGIWTLSNALLGAAGLANLGLGDATTKFVAQFAAQANEVKIGRVLIATLIVYSGIGLIVSVSTWALSPLIARGVFGALPTEEMRVTAVLRIISLGFFPAMAMYSIQGFFDGIQRFDVSQRLAIARSTITVAGGVGILAAGGGLLGLAWLLTGAVWITMLAGIVLVGVRVSWSHAVREDLLATLREVVGFGAFSTLTGIGTITVGQFDKIVIGRVLGLDSVTYYAIPQSIAMKAHALCAAACRVLLPAISERQALSDDLGRIAYRGWRISAMMSLSGLLVLASTAPWFLKVWVGDELAARVGAIYYIELLFSLWLAISIVPHYTLMAINRPQWVAWATVVAGAAMLSLMVAAGRSGSLVVVTVAALAYPAICSCMGVMMVRVIGDCPGGFTRGVVAILVVHSAIASCALALGHLVSSATGSDIGALVASGAAALVLLTGMHLAWKTGNPFIAAVRDARRAVFDRR